MANPFEIEKDEAADKAAEAKEGESDTSADSNTSLDRLKLIAGAGSYLKDSFHTLSSSLLPGFDLTGKDSGAESKAPKPAEQTASESKKEPAAQREERSVLVKTGSGNSAEKPASKNTQELPKDKKVSPDILPKELSDKVIDRINDTQKPVEDIKEALKKLDNLKDATVTINGKTSHIDVHFAQGKTVAPPNVSQRGFRPVASHIGSHVKFDLTALKNGMLLENVDGLTSTVRGPLGRMRHSETNSMFIGRDQQGPFVRTESDLHMRRRIHTSTTVLREHQFPADSPIRSAMNHPESLQKVSGMLRLFQDKHDTEKLGLVNRGKDGIDVFSQAKSKDHVELDFKPENLKLPVPVTVKSLDLDKKLSATISQNKDSVSLEKISGLTVNLELGKVKVSLAPSKVELQNDKVNLELKHPETGESMPISIPISKLKEAASKARSSR